MSYREVTDASGVAWQVWEVHPSLADRRRQAQPTPPAGLERRKRRSARSPLPGKLHAGWLAMRSPTERRRVSPVPEGWADLPNEQLQAIIETAEVTGVPRRLLE